MSRSLSHEVGILTLGRVFTYAVMFLVPLVNVRTLSVEEYGYYRQFWLLFETLTPMAILGFSRSLLYYLPRVETRGEKSAYITQTVLFLALGSVVAMGIYAVMAIWFGEGLGATARAFFWRLCFFTLFMVVTDYLEVLFVAQRRPVAQSAYHVTAWGLQAIVVMAVSYLTRDVSAIIWAITLLGLARFVFGILYTNSNYGLSLHAVSRGSLREQASFAVPVGLAGIGVIMITQTDKFLINRFMGREAFAIYSVGAFQVPLANIIQSSISNVTFPLMAKYQKAGQYAELIGLWQRSLMKAVVLFFPIFVFLEVTARPFITILFTEQYADATPVFMIYLLLFLRGSIEAGAIIQVFNRTVFSVVAFFVGFVVDVILGILLYKTMGRLGVPLAALLTLTTLSAASLWFSAKLLGTSLLKLVPAWPLTKRFLVAAAPGVILSLLYQRWPVTNVYQMGAAGLLYSGLYAGLCAWTRLVTVDDLKALVGRTSI